MVVIGWSIADALFPFQDPIGKRVILNGRRYTVIGVLEEQGVDRLRVDRRPRACSPSSPSTTPSPGSSATSASTSRPFRAAPELIDQVIEEGTNILRLRRGLRFDQPNDFGIMTPDMLIGNLRAVTDGISATMVLIASIALLVGGVGVMNIMLVSVTERTREIGLRKALGAVRQDILVQFLIEASALALLGGAIGVGIGVGIAALVRNVSPLDTATPLWSILVGLGVSMSVGLVFGIFPAWRAAKLDPIEALRYE